MDTLSEDAHAQSAWVLSQNEVHIWKARMRTSIAEILQMQQWLTPDERQRAQRFYFEKDRHHFISARGGLRKLLGLYLECEPEVVHFQYNEYGKPALDLPEHPLNNHLQFNISHSHELILYAFVLDQTVGVDVEYMRKNIEHESLASYHFSAYEQQALRALPDDLKLEGFYNCWTRKEAYIKARGQGLSLPLDIFDVTLAPGEPAKLLESREDTQKNACWNIQALAPEEEYAGALAIEGHTWQVKYFVMNNLDDFSVRDSFS